MRHQPELSAERKGLLRLKLEANARRMGRLEYLASLPPELSAYLAGCQIIQPPELEAILRLFLILPDGIGIDRERPEGYLFREFAWPEKALQAAQATGFSHDHAPAYFFASGSNPIYRVPFGWVRQNLASLFRPEVGVITQDRSAGLVISNYCGYLAEDRNPAEEVYELAVRGHHRTGAPSVAV